MTDVYQRLAKKLDDLPNGFPPTESGIELKILQKIFEPEEAEMALKMRPMPETTEAISERLGIPVDEMQSILDNMVKKGQIGSANMKGNQVYMLFPFVFGIFEFQLNRMDKELSDMMEEYGPTFMKTLGGTKPEFMRVVPVSDQIKAEHQVSSYEDLKQMMEKAKSFQVMECICRKEQALQGHPCKHPSTEVCLGFASHENAFDRYPMGRIISRDEAFDVLRKADEEGLVHQSYNVKSGQMFVCNCCDCCCGVIRGLKKFGAPHLMAKSHFVAAIDQDACEQCGVCADERCPMDAIEQRDDDSYHVIYERCIGCGVCTTTCPTEAIQLQRKPESEREEPAENLVDWYFKKAASRGKSLIIE
jgi:Pyruvate/2-oxoacid:ferredoxin oxidoreductase delta subunit